LWKQKCIQLIQGTNSGNERTEFCPEKMEVAPKTETWTSQRMLGSLPKYPSLEVSLESSLCEANNAKESSEVLKEAEAEIAQLKQKIREKNQQILQIKEESDQKNQQEELEKQRLQNELEKFRAKINIEIETKTALQNQNHELEQTVTQLHQTLDNLRTKNSQSFPKARAVPLWVPDRFSDSCAQCDSFFSFLRRRHHCRQCGGIYCGECSNNSAVIPSSFYGNTHVRLCNSCYKMIFNPVTPIFSPHLVNEIP